MTQSPSKTCCRRRMIFVLDFHIGIVQASSSICRRMIFVLDFHIGIVQRPIAFSFFYLDSFILVGLIYRGKVDYWIYLNFLK